MRKEPSPGDILKQEGVEYAKESSTPFKFVQEITSSNVLT